MIFCCLSAWWLAVVYPTYPFIPLNTPAVSYALFICLFFELRYTPLVSLHTSFLETYRCHLDMMYTVLRPIPRSHLTDLSSAFRHGEKFFCTTMYIFHFNYSIFWAIHLGSPSCILHRLYVNT